jgi:cold shock CspA family protein
MQGTMIWFNLDKGYGFIRTEDDERLYVARSGFLPGNAPEGRCKGRAVTFDRETGADDAYAANVSYVERDEPRRARLRSSRAGHKL